MKDYSYRDPFSRFLNPDRRIKSSSRILRFTVSLLKIGFRFFRWFLLTFVDSVNVDPYADHPDRIFVVMNNFVTKKSLKKIEIIGITFISYFLSSFFQ